MEPWFTVESIDSDTYAISEYRHWEETHCYLVCGKDFSILIDSGLGIANIQRVVKRITALPVLVVTTHVHWDHIGGHKYFSDIAVHENEVQWISKRFPLPLQAVKNNLISKPCDFPSDFELDHYRIYQGAPSRILHDGDVIDCGERRLRVIHTPGHSPGHCCFYEENRGYLYSGDLIYSGTLDLFYPTTDPFAFMQSVKKIKMLDVKVILPGHHQRNISVDLIDKIDHALQALYLQNKLFQGTGIVDFGEFQIHL